MMLRGLRWQLLALIAAIGLFAAVIILKPTSETVYVSEQGTPIGAATVPVVNAAETAQPGGATEELIPTLTPFTPEPQVTQAPADSSASASTDNGGVPTYREALVGHVQRLNPLLAGLNPVDQDISSLIYEGLVGVNEYGEPVPKLAVS